MRPLADLAGVRDFPFLMEVQQGKEGAWGERSCPPFSRASVFAFSHGKRAHFQAVSLLNGSSGLHPSFQFPRLIQVLQPTSHGITFPAHAHHRAWF